MLKTFVSAMADTLVTIWTDKGARVIILGATLFFCLFVPQPYLAELVRDTPVLVIDQDGSQSSRELIRRIDATDSIAVRHVSDMSAAKELFLKRQAFGIIVVPENFEHDLLVGRSAPIAAYTDGSYFVLNSAMGTALTNVTLGFGAEVQMSRLVAAGTDRAAALSIVAPLTITAVPLFNPQGGYASFLLPGLFVLILQQTLLVGIATLRTRRPSAGIVASAGEAAVYVGLYCLLGAVALFVLMPFVFGLPRLGSITTVFLVMVPFLAAVTAMGFLLAKLIFSREGLMFFLVVFSMPLFLLSGMSWPAESIPPAVHWLSLLVPSTSAIPAIVRINQMGAGQSAVEGTIVLQVVLALAYAALAIVAEHLPHRGKNQALSRP
jgi:ABC-2 type transport system permease protein